MAEKGNLYLYGNDALCHDVNVYFEKFYQIRKNN